MSEQALLCFGGPLNERMIAADRHLWEAVAESRQYTSLTETEWAAEMRKVTYRREVAAFHDSRVCRNVYCTDACRWTAECWVADGYPMHRITDALNGLAALALLAAGWR